MELFMELLLFLGLLALTFVLSWYFSTYGSENEKRIRKMCEGKSQFQKNIIIYFLRRCKLKMPIADDDFYGFISWFRNDYNSAENVLGQLGVDEDEVKEIAPVHFEGFRYSGAYLKTNSKKQLVSSIYETSWLFFSSNQIFVYKATMNLFDNTIHVVADEFFYRDIVSFSTLSDREVTNTGMNIPMDSFSMLNSGGERFTCSMTNVPDAKASIDGMKQLLREKKGNM